MKYDFDSPVSRRDSNSIKWESPQLLKNMEISNILPLWVADMDFVVAEPIRQALLKRVQHGVFGYSYVDESYYQAIISWYQRRHAFAIDRESICFSPGIVPGIAYLLRLLTQPGDAVLIQPPVYYPFAAEITNAGCQIVENPLLEDENGYYHMDFADLQEKAKQAKVMILCSPHNPVGRVWTEAELRQVADICFSHDVFVITDEIHNDLLRKNIRHICLASMYPEEQRLVTCLSASKSFNLAGLSCSSLIIPDPDLRRRYKEYLQQVVHVSSPSVLAQAAFQAAYLEGEEWLDQLCAYLDGSIVLVQQFLFEQLPLAVFYPPQGSYLIWLNVSAYVQDTQVFVRDLAIKTGVVLENGELFGAGGRGHLRLNIACPRGLLQRALQILAQQLKSV